MTDDHYNQPAQGTENWDEPLNENFADLGVEVANEVATWNDLPATTDVTQSSDGQWPVYRVDADDVFVRVTDSAKEIVGGLGSADHPLPESHHESLQTEQLSLGPDADFNTVSPSDNWHEVVGDADNPVSNAHLVLLPGDHETKRETILRSNVVVTTVGDATITKPEPLTQGLAADASQGSNTVTVQNGSAYEVGRGVVIQSDTRYQRDTTHTYITDISGDTLTLNSSLKHDYTTADNAICSQTHSLLTTGVDPSESPTNIHVQNVGFNGGGKTADGPQEWTVACFYSQELTDGSIRDCDITEHHGDGISVQDGEGTEIANNTITNIGTHPIHIGLGIDGAEVRGNTCKNSVGTGIYTSTAITGCTIKNNNIVDCEGNITGSVGANAGGIGDFVANDNNNVIRDNYIDLTGVTALGIQAFDNTYGNEFVDNTILTYGADGIYLGDTSDVTVKDNRIIADTDNSVCIAFGGDGVDDVRIVDNHLESGETGASNGCLYAQGSVGSDNVTVRGNTLVEHNGLWPIFLTESGATCTDWMVVDNHVKQGDGLISSNASVEDFQIRGNTGLTDVGFSTSDRTRVTVDGWSLNAGDPNSTGAWNGNGREGVNVRDTANGNNYAYVDGGWVAL